MAIGSCRYRKQIVQLRNLFTVLKTVRQGTEGKRFNPSSFRPSRITQMLLAGMNPAEVGRMVGQTSSSIQDRYLRVQDHDVADFWESMDKKVGAA